MFKLKKRCIRCYHVLRENGTCQNPDCVRYTPEDNVDTKDSTTSAESGTATTTEEKSTT